MDIKRINRESVTIELLDLIEDAKDAGKYTVQLQAIKILIELHGLSKTRQEFEQDLIEMTQQDLQRFIELHDVEAEPTPRGGVEIKNENIDLIPRKKFDILEGMEDL